MPLSQAFGHGNEDVSIRCTIPPSTSDDHVAESVPSNNLSDRQTADDGPWYVSAGTLVASTRQTISPLGGFLEDGDASSHESRDELQPKAQLLSPG